MRRSPGSSLLLDREQSRIEGVGIRAGHDPFQGELRVQRVDENIPFARRDDRGYEHCRRSLSFKPRITKCSADRELAFPSRWERIGFQDQRVWDFRGIGINGLDVIRLFEADQDLKGSERERLRRVNDRVACYVPAGRGVQATFAAESFFPGTCEDRCPNAERPHALQTKWP